MAISVSRRIVIAGLCAFISLAVLRVALAEEDLSHAVTGVVKRVDKDASTLVIQAEDKTEHTIKWSDLTTWMGTKEAMIDMKKGTKVTVKYTETAGEKTAIEIKKLD